MSVSKMSLTGAAHATPQTTVERSIGNSGIFITAGVGQRGGRVPLEKVLEGGRLMSPSVGTLPGSGGEAWKMRRCFSKNGISARWGEPPRYAQAPNGGTRATVSRWDGAGAVPAQIVQHAGSSGAPRAVWEAEPLGRFPLADTTYLRFLDDWRRPPCGSIIPHSSETRCGLPPNRTPRKGQFTSSPWQRRGKIVPIKNTP